MPENKETFNTYWPIYKNLEKEVVELANSIHFSDEQLFVYSIKIAELIARISIEIESIFQDLYKAEFGEVKASIGAKISKINDKFHLDKKYVLLTASNMYFHNFKKLTPFVYDNDDTTNYYYAAYNAIKHERAKNLSMATIQILLNSMAALFVLNIYFKNENFRAKRFNFDFRFRSELFEISYSEIRFNIVNGELEYGTENESSIYLIRYTQEDVEKIVKLSLEGHKRQLEFVSKSQEFKDYFSRNPNLPGNNLSGSNLVGIAIDIGGAEFASKLVHLSFTRELRDLYVGQQNIELNKGQYQINPANSKT